MKSLVTVLAVVLAGIAAPGETGTFAAQGSGPCELVTASDVRPLAGKADVGDGVLMSSDPAGYGECRYVWGDGVDRFRLDFTVNDASRVFVAMGPDLIKQGLNASVSTGTADAVISDVGDAAVFKADSALSVHATALVKGRILQVRLDGFIARDKKDQVIELLKTAVSRL